jgi:general secretion pathway protein G
MTSSHAKPGFTFIELVVVITIVALMAVVAIPSYMTFRARAKKSLTITSLKTLGEAIDMYHGDVSTYPNTLVDLVDRPSDEKTAKKWQGPYIKKEAKDGYGNEFIYQVTKGGKHPYELASWGANGEGSPEAEWLSVWEI